MSWVRRLLVLVGLIRVNRGQISHDRLMEKADRILAEARDADLRITVVRKR